MSYTVGTTTASDHRNPTEDEVAFGKDAWVYCRPHMRTHQTGWCGVRTQFKVGLGVRTEEEAETKCREWGFELSAEQEEQ